MIGSSGKQRTDNKMTTGQQARVETVSTNPHQSYCTTVGKKIKRILLCKKYIQLILKKMIVPKCLEYSNDHAEEETA